MSEIIAKRLDYFNITYVYMPIIHKTKLLVVKSKSIASHDLIFVFSQLFVAWCRDMVLWVWDNTGSGDDMILWTDILLCIQSNTSMG